MKILALTVVLLLIMPVFSMPAIAVKYSEETETFSATNVPGALLPPLPPMVVPPPQPTHNWNHWWILDYWDTFGGGSMPPFMGGEFIAEANTFGGLTEGVDPAPGGPWFDLVYYLPLNAAYGASRTNCVWFQFAIMFVDPVTPPSGYSPVTMQIWDINGPANVAGDFHETDIGLAYTAGHRYSFSLTVTGVNQITFYIKDETSNTDWSKNNWLWPITNTTLLADESMFSPSSAVEGYTEPGVASLSGTPFLQSRIGPSVTTNRHYNVGTPPAGITTTRIEIGDYDWYNWIMLTPGSLPSPSFFADYPAIVHNGDTVLVHLYGYNGGGTAYDQSLSISFPAGESVNNVAIVATNLTSHAVRTPGSVLSAHYGLTTATLSNYLVGGEAIPWNSLDTYYLDISFKPMIGSGSFTFYVKSIAAMRLPNFDTIWYPQAELLGGFPALKDQQGEYVQDLVLTVDSIPPATTLTIGIPNYLSGSDVYVTSATPFTLAALDNVGGSGVQSTTYRIHSASYDSGWLTYTGAFYLTGLVDGLYSIDYYSTDNANNIEATNTSPVILDNTPPVTLLTIGNPQFTDASGNLYVASWTPFTLSATDAGSGVATTSYRIHNAGYDSGWLAYTTPFTLSGLITGKYNVDYRSTDNLGNAEPIHTRIVILNSKAAMIGVVKNEIQALINHLHGSTIWYYLRNFLEYNVLNCALKQANMAFDFAVAGNAASANSALGTCKRTMEGFMSYVVDLTIRFGLIPVPTAIIWVIAAQTIINDINTAIATPI